VVKISAKNPVFLQKFLYFSRTLPMKVRRREISALCPIF